MKSAIVSAWMLAISMATSAQTPATKGEDAWTNVHSAPDDRYTNPKKPLYAGPNGWFNFGEVRASVANAPAVKYEFKGGFQLTTHTFTAVGGETKLWVMTLDFGSDTPAPGDYEASAKPNLAQKKVQVSFGDVSDKKIRNWTSADKAGTVTVSLVNGFVYFKYRGVSLQPNGTYNVGELKNPMTIGFEGAVSPQKD